MVRPFGGRTDSARVSAGASAPGGRIVDANAIGRIVGLPDPGLANYFVTLAYYDLSRVLVAYTHALDDTAGGYGGGASADALAALADDAAARLRRYSRDAMTGEGELPLVVGSGTSFDQLKAAAAEGLPKAADTGSPVLNANFCTYAMWTSLSLGRDIRNELLPYRLEGSLPEGLRPMARRLLTSSRGIQHGRLADRLGEGQRLVLWEVGLAVLWLIANADVLDAELDHLGASRYDPPAFDTFRNHHRNRVSDALLNLNPLTDALRKVIADELRADAVDRPGAERLRPVQRRVVERRAEDLWVGLASFHLARRFSQWSRQEPAFARLAAEMVLRGSILVVSYEQQRVQTVLDYPARDFGSDYLLDRIATAGIGPSRGGSLRRRAYGWVESSITDPLSDLWERLVTDQLLVAQAGDELLRIGRDIPVPPGQATFFPAELRHLEDDWLDLLFRRYDHSFGDGHGTQARVWWNYNDRMSFIVNFMRSHAQVPGMFRPPFDEAALATIREGNAPKGDRS